jgi:hypothetical protein
MGQYGYIQKSASFFNNSAYDQQVVSWRKDPSRVAVTAQATGIPFALRPPDQFFGLGGPSYDYPNPRGHKQPQDVYGFFGQSIFPINPPQPIPALAFSSDMAIFTCDASDSPSGQGWSGGGYMAKYEIDTSIQLNAVFLNPLAGVPIDPTEVEAFVMDPTGTITNYNSLTPFSGVIRDNVGRYHLTIEPSLPGVWTYKFQGVGNANATSPDTIFTVAASAFLI